MHMCSAQPAQLPMCTPDKTLLSALSVRGRLISCGSEGRGESEALTAAVAAAGVQGIMRGAAAAVAAGDGQAQLATLPVVVHAVVEAVLAGGVEHQDVHHEVQVALDEGAVPAAGLVGPLDAVQVPVCPVDVITVLGQAEGVREIICDHDPLLTCAETRGRGVSQGTAWAPTHSLATYDGLVKIVGTLGNRQGPLSPDARLP